MGRGVGAGYVANRSGKCQIGIGKASEGVSDGKCVKWDRERACRVGIVSYEVLCHVG